MILLSATLLVTAAPVLPSSAGLPRDGDGTEAASPASTDNVLRVYDVSGLSLGWFEEDENGVRLFPSVGPFEDENLESDSSGDGSETFVDMILGLYEAEFEYEGRRVSMSNDGRLVVRGPESLHERVGATIVFLESVINSAVVLSVDTVVLAGPGPDAAIIDASAAEAWLAGLPSSVDHHRHTMRVRSDREAHLNVGGTTSALVDFNVEIAQGSAIQDPIVAQVKTGTNLRMLGAPGSDGGLFLSYVLERADLQSKGWREVALSFWAGSERGNLELKRDVSRMNTVDMLSRSQVNSTYLPDGKALVITNDIDVQGAQLHEVVLIRRVGGGLPLRQELPLYSGGTRLIFADLGAVSPPGTNSWGTLFSGRTERLAWKFHHEFPIQSSLSSGDYDMAVDLIDTGMDYSGLEQIGRYLVLRPYGEYGDDEEIAHAKVEQDLVVRAFDALLAAPDVFDVDVKVKGPGGRSVHARLPMRSGADAAIVLGQQTIHPYDYDVEVAQFSAVGDLSMETVLDGMCLWMRLNYTAGGSLIVTTKGGAQLVTSEHTFDLGGAIIKEIDQNDTLSVMLNERTLLKEKGGVWSVTYGDTSGSGMSLTITVRRI
ncbi:MAG: hypothetical protein O2816_09065 [Planctomycetota bacterium]|nr:hypothetical protein [Planctomycetota bacterium]